MYAKIGEKVRKSVGFSTSRSDRDILSYFTSNNKNKTKIKERITKLTMVGRISPRLFRIPATTRTGYRALWWAGLAHEC